MKKLHFKFILWVLLLRVSVFIVPASLLANDTLTKRTNTKKSKPNNNLSISDLLQVFYPVMEAEYSIAVCADLPVNNNPKCIYRKGEPGHVFLILTKYNPLTTDFITRSFGFYPRVPASCLIKQIRSEIIENNNREYDASLNRKLTREEFAFILEKCKQLAKKKYNLKKFNCYDYVIEVFNSLPGIEKLPVSVVKFPFILGRGGSPCGLYSDLKELLSNGSAWAPFIRFGLFRSPSENFSENLLDSF